MSWGNVTKAQRKTIKINVIIFKWPGPWHLHYYDYYRSREAYGGDHYVHYFKKLPSGTRQWV